MKPKYDQYVHEFTDKKGIIRFAVAEWIEENNQFIQPNDKATIELTGCDATFSKDLSYFGGYKTKRQALRRARYIFGQTIPAAFQQ